MFVDEQASSSPWAFSTHPKRHFPASLQHPSTDATMATAATNITASAATAATSASALRRTHLLRQLEEEGQQTVSAQTSFRDDTPEPPIIVHSYNSNTHNNQQSNYSDGAALAAATTKTATILVSKTKTKTGLPLMLKNSSNLK